MYAMAVTIVFIAIASLFGNELFKNSIKFAQRRNDYQVRWAMYSKWCSYAFGNAYGRP